MTEPKDEKDNEEFINNLYQKEKEISQKEQLLKERMMEIKEDAKLLKDEGIKLHDVMVKEKAVNLAASKLNEKAILVEEKLRKINKERIIIDAILDKEKDIQERSAALDAREKEASFLEGQLLQRVNELAKTQVDMQNKKEELEAFVKHLNENARAIEKFIASKKQEEKIILEHLTLDEAKKLSNVEQAMLIAQKETDLAKIKDAVEGRISEMEEYSKKIYEEKEHLEKLKEKTKEISEQHAAINIAKDEIEKKKQELENIKDAHAKDISKREEALAELKSRVSESIRGLNEHETLLSQKEHLLEQLNYAVDQKFLLTKKEKSRLEKFKIDLDIRSQRLAKETNLYEKKLEHLKTRMDDLTYFEEQAKQRIEEQEKRFKTKLSVLKKEFGEKLENKAFYLDASIKKREAFLTEKEYRLEKDFSNKKKAIQDMKRELIEVTNELEQKVVEFRKEQVNLANIKYDVVDKIPTLNNDYSVLKKKLDVIESKWNQNLNELKKKQGMLEEYKKLLIPIAKEIKQDIVLLEKKEEDISAGYKEIEKERANLYTQESTIDKKFKKLETLDKDIIKKETEINSIKNIIRDEEKMMRNELKSIGKVEEITKKLPKLRRSYRKIMSKVERINQDALAKHITLRNKEMDLIKREKALKIKQDKLKILLLKFDAQKSAFEKLKEESIFKFIKDDIPITESEVDKIPDPKTMIKDMLVTVRELISQKKTEKASDILARIEKEFQKIGSGDLEELGYEIMELKTDIKLSEL